MNNDTFKRMKTRLPQIGFSHADIFTCLFPPESSRASQFRVCMETPVCEPSVKTRTLDTIANEPVSVRFTGIDKGVLRRTKEKMIQKWLLSAEWVRGCASQEKEIGPVLTRLQRHVKQARTRVVLWWFAFAKTSVGKADEPMDPNGQRVSALFQRQRRVKAATHHIDHHEYFMPDHLSFMLDNVIFLILLPRHTQVPTCPQHALPPPILPQASLLEAQA